jgi:hypothetical protein
MTEAVKCQICDDAGWVCENHPDKPWDGTSSRADACGCGAGAPCKACNPCDDETAPDTSRAMRTVFDKDGWRH